MSCCERRRAPERSRFLPPSLSLGGWIWAWAALLPFGCKSMTEAKLASLEKALEDRHAQVLQEEAALRETVEKLNKEATFRSARQAQLKDAEQKLASGDAKSALVLVDALLAPATATDKDPATGKKETGDEPPRGMEKGEHSTLLSLRGSILAELQRLDEAQASYRESLKIDSKNRASRRNLGRLLLSAKQYKAALDAWQPELADGQRDAELLLLVGLSRYELGKAEGSAADLEAARIAFENVLLERPDDVETIRHLASISYESGKYADAQRYYDLARRQAPLDGEDLEKLGYCALFLGDRRKALDYLELSAGSKLPSRELCAAISALCAEFHFPARAAEWLAQAYKNEPSAAPPETRIKVGSLFVEAWRGEEALTWLAAVGPGDGSYEEAQALLVKVHASAGRSDDALSAYEKAKKASALDAAIHLIAAPLYLQRKNYDSAIAAYSKASGTAKLKADGLAGLAEVALAKEDPEGALKYYREASIVRPGDPALLAAMSQIQDDLASSGANSRTASAAQVAPQKAAR